MSATGFVDRTRPCRLNRRHTAIRSRQAAASAEVMQTWRCGWGVCFRSSGKPARAQFAGGLQRPGVPEAQGDFEAVQGPITSMKPGAPPAQSVANGSMG